MSIRKNFLKSLYIAFWTYAISDTLYPSYHYLIYSASQGFIQTNHKTGLRDIALFNIRSCYLALAVFALSWLYLEAKKHFLKKEYEHNLHIIETIGH